MARIRCPVGSLLFFFEKKELFFKWKGSQIDTDIDQKPKIFFFRSFRANFSLIVDKTCGLVGILKRVNKERVRRPVGFSEEYITSSLR